jgi:hypothetical protein
VHTGFFSITEYLSLWQQVVFIPIALVSSLYIRLIMVGNFFLRFKIACHRISQLAVGSLQLAALQFALLFESK